MLLFFWVIPLGDCYAAFQPSVVQSDRQIRWFECFPLTSCRRLQKGFISLVSRVMWLCCLCNCQQRYDCEEEGFKTFVYSLGAPLKPPCGWCHRGSHNHRNHICVHTNKMIKRSQISLDYFDCHWKQRWFGAQTNHLCVGQWGRVSGWMCTCDSYCQDAELSFTDPFSVLNLWPELGGNFWRKWHHLCYVCIGCTPVTLVNAASLWGGFYCVTWRFAGGANTGSEISF